MLIRYLRKTEEFCVMQINIIDVIIKKIGGLNMLTTPLGKIEIYMRYIYYGKRIR